MSNNIIPVFGDWHSHTNWALRALKYIAKAGHTRALHVGDFNIGFGGDFENRISDICQRLNIHIGITPGNHENFDVINALPMVETGEWAGWLQLDEAGHLLVAPRGHHWNWSGVEFASLGGGNSIDYTKRLQGFDWWREEAITMADLYQVEAGGRADVMIAHVAPFNAVYDLDSDWDAASVRYSDEARMVMGMALDAVQPKVFFHGHYHTDKEQTSQAVTETGEHFKTKFVSLGMNGKRNNLSLLDLEDLSTRFVAWPW